MIYLYKVECVLALENECDIIFSKKFSVVFFFFFFFFFSKIMIKLLSLAAI